MTVTASFRAWGIAGAVLLLAQVAEAQDKGAGDAAGERVCAPGLQVACACLGGEVTGIQVCREDGTGYSACQCPAASAPTAAPSSTGAPGAVAAPEEGERPVERGSLPALIGGIAGLTLGLTGLGAGAALYIEDEAKNVTPAAGIILVGSGALATLLSIPTIFIGVFYPKRQAPKGPPAGAITVVSTANGLAFRF